MDNTIKVNDLIAQAIEEGGPNNGTCIAAINIHVAGKRLFYRAFSEGRISHDLLMELAVRGLDSMLSDEIN